MIRHPSNLVERARQLRLQKLSFQEISKLVDIPSSTIRHWCYNMGINNHESLRINNEFRRRRIKELDLGIIPELNKVTTKEAKLFAALLYGCEGGKYPSTNYVSFVNSDPKLVKLFLSLLRKAYPLKEHKIKIHLQIHTLHNFQEVLDYWSSMLNVPASQFIKPTITIPRGKMRRQDYMGTCSLRYIDHKIQLRLLGVFEAFCYN